MNRKSVLWLAALVVGFVMGRGANATQTLTVSVAGTGTGSITSSPAGISCPFTCSAGFADGTPVTLTAMAGSGSTFTGWSGACSGTGPCMVTMDQARSVTATFTLNQYTLTVSNAGTGAGSVTAAPAGINCPTTCSSSYTHGTMVSLTPTPYPGSTFGGWSGACTGTGACVVSMTLARSVTALWNGQSIPLDVTIAGSGTGTVTSAPAGISCPSACITYYALNTPVTLTATPGPNSAFTGWSGACSGTGACGTTMSVARSVTATFTATSFPLTVVHLGSGTMVSTTSPAGINCPGTCTAQFANGSTVTIASVPAIGTTFAGFTGADSSSGNVATVLMNGPRTVTVGMRCAADFNGGGLAVQDIFDFLSAWFAGCP